MALKNPFRRTDKDKRPMDHEPLNDPQNTSDLPLEEPQATANADTAAEPTGPEGSNEQALKAELEILRTEHTALHDKHVRLFAEFDNFRKRTAKEKLDLLQTAGTDVLKSILPVLDDMERAIANNATVEDIEVVKQGFELIHQKFVNLLLARGVKAMRAKGEPFDPELHEAITKAPAPTPDLKGKVLEVVENGYVLNDKVIRYAKVVVGE
jgi:molecular chaperone GrpE